MYLKNFLIKKRVWISLLFLFFLLENNVKAVEFECDENIELNKKK